MNRYAVQNRKNRRQPDKLYSNIIPKRRGRSLTTAARTAVSVTAAGPNIQYPRSAPFYGVRPETIGTLVTDHALSQREVAMPARASGSPVVRDGPRCYDPPRQVHCRRILDGTRRYVSAAVMRSGLRQTGAAFGSHNAWGA